VKRAASMELPPISETAREAQEDTIGEVEIVAIDEDKIREEEMRKIRENRLFTGVDLNHELYF
jgi:hypothetical protein